MPPSYELFFALLQGGKLIVPGGGKRAIACISPKDVGAIAAQAVFPILAFPVSQPEDDE